MPVKVNLPAIGTEGAEDTSGRNPDRKNTQPAVRLCRFVLVGIATVLESFVLTKVPSPMNGVGERFFSPTALPKAQQSVFPSWQSAEFHDGHRKTEHTGDRQQHPHFLVCHVSTDLCKGRLDPRVHLSDACLGRIIYWSFGTAMVPHILGWLCIPKQQP